MKYHVTVGGEERIVEVDADGTIHVDGESITGRVTDIGGEGRQVLWLNQVPRVVRVTGGRGEWIVALGGERFTAAVQDDRVRRARGSAGNSTILAGPRPLDAPMPGLVVKVEVAQGDVVEKGAGLVIIEAMKMENELRATTAGRVSRIHVADGDTVEAGTRLIEFEPHSEE